MGSKKTFGKYGGNHYGRGLGNSRKRKEKQKGGNETIYIKKSKTPGVAEGLYPILKNVFSGKNIEFVDDVNISKLSVSDNGEDTKDRPFIQFSGESKDGVNKELINLPHNLLSLVSTNDSSFISDKIVYLPMFLNIGPCIYTESPFKRIYQNNERPYIAAYITRHFREHHDKMFKAVKALDNEDKVHGLGTDNHTKDVTLANDWYNLPEIYKDYLFVFVMENKEEDGYITEKIMNAYRGGAIPIYWGTSKVKEIFNTDSFIYVNDYESFEKCAEDIMNIVNDKERLTKLQQAPIFKENAEPDYSKYWDTPSPQWVINISNKIKDRLNLILGGSKKKRLTRKKRKIVGGNQKNKLVMSLMGGLGNRFFQIMAGLGFAEKWDMELFLKEGAYNHVPEDVSKKDILQLFPRLKFIDKSINITSYKHQEIYDNIENPKSNIILSGFFNDKKYFPKHDVKIHLVEPSHNIIKDIDKNKLFFIHLRLGDYKNIEDYQLPPTYYKNSVKKIKEYINDAIFIIITNEQSLGKEFIQKELIDELANSTILYENGTSEKRLDSIYYMSQCKGGICANSTFSWFGAYCIPHKDKNLLFMPNPWFISLKKEFTSIYPEWVTIIYNDENQKGYAYNKILISFADKGYENAKKSQKESALKEGTINTVFQYTFDDMDQEFKDKNKEILALSRGAGYWIWKPYFILKTLNTMNENDVLIYCDTAMTFIGSLDDYINKMESSVMLFQHTTNYIEKQFTKGDIFKELNCLDDKNITDTKQLDGSHSIWKKDDKSIAFVTEWLKLCENKQLLTDEPSIEPNLEEFSENRHDQSILSVLAKEKKENYNIQIENSATDYGPRATNSNLPVLLHHHRSRN
jgi:hypothetical protein